MVATNNGENDIEKRNYRYLMIIGSIAIISIITILIVLYIFIREDLQVII